MPEPASGGVPVSDPWSWTGPALDIAQIAAIIIGAIWVYFRFVRHRELWPRVALEHMIQHWKLADGRRLLRVVEKLTNTGGVLLHLDKRITRVQQILPMEEKPLKSLEESKEDEAPWHKLAEPHETAREANPPELEPGELDHFEHDFLIDDQADVIQVYSHFQNLRRRRRWQPWKKDDRGWTLTTTYDLRDPDPTRHKMEESK